jgi:SIR2-like protein/CHAT domain-containing protein
MAAKIVAESTVIVHGPEQPRLPADRPELPVLVNYIRAGRCALFVGAGLSAPAGLPTWSDLMRRLMAEALPWAIDADTVPANTSLIDNPLRVHHEPEVRAIRGALGQKRFHQLRRLIRRWEKARAAVEVAHAVEIVRRDSLARRELERLLEQKRFPELAGYLREYLGRDHFQSLVGQALQPLHGLPSTYSDIVKTPFACVVTTNFDNLLEEAYVRWDGRGIPRAPTGAELAEHGTLLLDRAFFILKAHGDLRRPETMIFTADDYRRVIHANPAFQALLSGILLTHAVLFVGYSLSDTNFRLLLDNQLTIFNGNVPPRFALLDGVESAELEILWRTAKLRVLPYPRNQHKEVARFLAKLAAPFSTAKRSTTAINLSPGRFPGAPASISYYTLRIGSQGEALTFELVRRDPQGNVEQLWVGGNPWPSKTRLMKLMGTAASAVVPNATNLKHLHVMSSLLTSALPPALRRKLRGMIRSQTLELACSRETSCLPWEWLLIGNRQVCLRRPVLRSPVEVRNAARGFRFAQARLRFLVIGDAGIGDLMLNQSYALPGAELEATRIVQQIRCVSPRQKVTRLSQKEATRARFLQILNQGECDVIHFGGHAWFSSYESYLCFWDGVILGSEIAPLLSRCPPALLVLNTHFTAFRPAGVMECDFTDLIRTRGISDTLEGDGACGFTTLAMGCGITSFVGSFGSVIDVLPRGRNVKTPSVDLIVAFYTALLRGQTVAEALYTARRHTIRKDRGTPLFYTVSGYPEFRLVTGARAKKRTNSGGAIQAKAYAQFLEALANKQTR